MRRFGNKSAAPKGMPRVGGGMGAQAAKPGYGMKHRLRKGTEFPGMDTTDSGLADPMSDYARMVAAGGGGA